MGHTNTNIIFVTLSFSYLRSRRNVRNNWMNYFCFPIDLCFLALKSGFFFLLANCLLRIFFAFDSNFCSLSVLVIDNFLRFLLISTELLVFYKFAHSNSQFTLFKRKSIDRKLDVAVVLIFDYRNWFVRTLFVAFVILEITQHFKIIRCIANTLMV